MVLDLILSNLVPKMDFLMQIQQATSFLQRIWFPKIAFLLSRVSTIKKYKPVLVYPAAWMSGCISGVGANYVTKNLDKDPERMACFLVIVNI